MEEPLLAVVVVTVGSCLQLDGTAYNCTNA